MRKLIDHEQHFILFTVKRDNVLLVSLFRIVGKLEGDVLISI